MMKALLDRLERLLAGVTPHPVGKGGRGPIAAYLGFTGSRHRNALVSATKSLRRVRREDTERDTLRALAHLARRGRVHPRVLIYLAFVCGWAAGKKRRIGIVNEQHLPALLEKLGIRDAEVLYSGEGFTVWPLPWSGALAEEPREEGDGGKGVTWN
jgi:hypothetical protein